jgi:hypothetical protein
MTKRSNKKKGKYDGIRVGFAERNNKYRKGLYVVLSAKGHPRRELKLKEGLQIDDMVQHYKDRYITKITNKNFARFMRGLRKDTKARSQTAKARKKLLKRKKIESSIKKGLTYTKEFDLLVAGNSMIRRKYKELLGPLVRDRELLEIIIQNADKIRHRFTYESRVLGNDGTGKEVLIGQIKDIGNRDLRKTVAEYQDEIKRGLVITSQTWRQIIKSLNKRSDNKLIDNYVDKAKVTFVMTRIVFTKN